MTERAAMKHLDVYQWQFKDHNEYLYQHKQSGTAYWALDRLLVVGADGGFYDTYKSYPSEWAAKSEDSFKFCTRLNPDDVVLLEKVCNLNEVRYISKWEKDKYENVFDLSYHHNHRKLYATYIDERCSKSKVLDLKMRELQEQRDILAYTKMQITNLEKQIAELKNEE